ncbi:MAG: hypothetical protein HY619_04170 [Thaumarchaeota archaeon]|nr:hypothetical protein [Nitrososphaerota archaeon]
MLDWKFALEITEQLCELGRTRREVPKLNLVEPLKHYFAGDGQLKHDELDEYDGKFTRREILTRYLLVSVVLDQGPDMTGVGELMREVTTKLYRKEVRVFHQPIEFFRELGVSIDEVLESHNSVKKLRAQDWARENNSNAAKYNLFFAQSQRGIISTRQVLDYVIHRWGVPLCVPLLLEKDLQKVNKESVQPLVDYLESWESAEIMAQELKHNERYGLGSAIGDKACHLFAKLYVSVFKLVKGRKNDPGWSQISYEVPFDSNAGRVLFRTGFLLECADLQDYKDWDVIQEGKGKGRVNHIRVTNIRGRKVQNLGSEPRFEDYKQIATKFLRTDRRPQSIEIQRLPNLLVYEIGKDEKNFSVGDFDDGLMFIGTNFCFNHENPLCQRCPLANSCKGHISERSLIESYTT